MLHRFFFWIFFSKEGSLFTVYSDGFNLYLLFFEFSPRKLGKMSILTKIFQKRIETTTLLSDLHPVKFNSETTPQQKRWPEDDSGFPLGRLGLFFRGVGSVLGRSTRCLRGIKAMRSTCFSGNCLREKYHRHCLAWCHDSWPLLRAGTHRMSLDLRTFCLDLWDINAKWIIKKERQVSLFHAFGGASCCQPCTLQNKPWFFLLLLRVCKTRGTKYVSWCINPKNSS